MESRSWWQSMPLSRSASFKSRKDVHERSAAEIEREESTCYCEIVGVPCDMSSPKRREAIVLTYASLLACVVFWILDAFKATKSTTSGIISSLLESLFDVFSTLLVCWRLRRADCFEETPENIIAEARTSVLLSACMVGIAFVLLGFTSFSVFEAHKNEKNAINHSQLGDEVSLSFPSAIIYLVIGMLQAGMGCSMRVRSLLQDGLISIMAAFVSLGALLAALINLMTCQYKEFLELPDDDLGSGMEIQNGTGTDVIDTDGPDADVRIHPRHGKGGGGPMGGIGVAGAADGVGDDEPGLKLDSGGVFIPLSLYRHEDARLPTDCH